MDDTTSLQGEMPGIAIVGMAGRFPGAADIEQFWSLICAGQEGLTRISRAELRSSGVPEELIDSPRYIPVNGILRDVEMFDAGFFSMPPREAEVTDPQHRVFLELAWQAAEHSGYDLAAYDGPVGVFAGSGLSSYLINNVWPRRADLSGLQLEIGNNKDYLPTRVSFKLNLTGPSANVSTACSTSLVAVHLACQALLSYQCDMALAGGVSIQVPQMSGYLHHEDSILSPDGHCRAFDAAAAGTVNGNGAAIVVLKRLSDALSDRDTVYAVIGGSAVNNDGADKAGYTAPSVQGQAQVIAESQLVAQVDPQSIGYVETHGTGTRLGDPIEIAALKQAFGDGTSRRQYCAIGSVKTNVGHLDEAAGVAGLVKTALCLHHRKITPSLHFESPNPEIDFSASPFYVNTELRDWPAPAGGVTRRAGVSSFGIGGTNAHVVLEEAPLVASKAPLRPLQLLPMSARSESALSRRSSDLAEWMTARPDLSLADAAFTLQVGRRAFSYRRFVLAGDRSEARSALASASQDAVKPIAQDPPPLVFMFPGQGSQHPQMARALYDSEPVFRRWVDACASFLAPVLKRDLRGLLYPSSNADDRLAQAELQQTSLAQPALFAVEYALAQLWRSWGVQPSALIGHSLGEYVAACLSGVLELEDALTLVAERGRLMQAAPPGAMLSVSLSPAAIRPHLVQGLEIAAINAPDRCVVSGPPHAIETLKARLEEEGGGVRRLHVSHAFHSGSLDPVLAPFAAAAGRLELGKPDLPYVSNLSGDWIQSSEATDPEYYARHLRGAVRFSAGIERILSDLPGAILLEVGPGRSLTQMAARSPQQATCRLTSLPSPSANADACRVLLTALGALWQRGVEVDWAAFAEDGRRRIALPRYPFERKRYWIEPQPRSASTAELSSAHPSESEDLRPALYVPSWKRAPRSEMGRQSGSWLLFDDQGEVGTELTARLRQNGEEVVRVITGQGFAQMGHDAYTVRPSVAADFRALVSSLARDRAIPRNIAYLWTISDSPEAGGEFDPFAAAQDLGFYSLIHLARSLASDPAASEVQLTVISSGIQEVTGEEELYPEKATLLGPVLVIQQEFPAIRCKSIDIPSYSRGTPSAMGVDQIFAELTAPLEERFVALRGRYRWVQVFDKVAVEAQADSGLNSEQSFDPFKAQAGLQLKPGGVYLITGGLGSLGLYLAQYLTEKAQAKLILTGRTVFPDRDQWESHLESRQAEDPLRRKILQLQRIENLGGDFLLVRADVADQAAMEEAVASAERRLGKVDGVIHAAGVDGQRSFVEIREIRRTACEEQFSVKARGLQVLARIFERRQPDFFLLFSSMSSILGGLGFCAYAAANSFLDAFARDQSRRGRCSWMSVNWDGWQLGTESTDRGQGINRSQGGRILDRVFSTLETNQVLVSVGDLQPKLEKWVRIAASDPAQIKLEQGLHRDEPVGHARPQLATPYLGPRNGEEEQLIAIWQELLGIERIGVHDDFFELKGDSLLGTQLIAQVNQRLGGCLTLRELFEQPTPAGLAARMTVKSSEAPLPIAPAPPAEDYPLTHGQRRLWVLSQNPEASIAYNMSYNLRLGGVLDVASLQKAFLFLVTRHEALRTQFVALKGEPRQRVIAPSTFGLPLLDLAGEDDPASRARAEVRREALDPFDLSRPPLIRARLLRLGPDDHVLLVTLHHIICDGWSLKLLIRELDEAYGEYASGREPSFAPLPIQHKDYAVWEERLFKSDAMQEHRAYWLDKLSGELPSLDLPIDRPRTAIQRFSGSNQQFLVPKSDQELLHQRCREDGASLFMFLTAAVKVLLHQASGQEEILVGSPVAGREQAELDGQIGYYLNNLVLRDRVRRVEPFATLLEKLRVTVVEAFAHQSYPFDRILDDLSITAPPGRSPLFDVQVNLMPRQTMSAKLGDLKVGSFVTEVETTMFDLNFMFTDGPQSLGIEIAYSDALFDAGTVTRLGEQLVAILKTLGQGTQVTIRTLCESLEGPEAAERKAKFLAAALDLEETF